MISRLVIAIIRIYQYIGSPMVGFHCRFYPTCSHYAIDALKTHGFMRGMVLTAWRLLRCNPWGGSGHDPVLDTTTADKNI